MSPILYLIGTDRQCPMRLVDQYAAAQHAAVWRDDAGLAWVKDLGSANGTLVRYPDGREVRLSLWQPGPAEIWPGCAIRVGRTWIPWTVKET